jgi:DNA ligase-1
MLCYPFEEKRLAKWDPPYIVQPKLDGERCRAVPTGAGTVYPGDYLPISSEENIFYSIPHIVKALFNLPFRGELDGELYCHGMSFENIHSIVSRTVNLHPDYREIKYYIFDIVDESKSQTERLVDLFDIREYFSKYLICVPIHICHTFEEVMRAYDSIIAEGYEGIIVRHAAAPYVRKRSIGMMKFKPKKEDYYEIVDWKEEVSKEGMPKGRLGALVCRGSDGTIFSVGSGLTDEARESLWKNNFNDIQGKFCRVSYQHLTSGKKVPRFPVFVDIVDRNPEEK